MCLMHNRSPLGLVRVGSPASTVVDEQKRGVRKTDCLLYNRALLATLQPVLMLSHA